MNVSSDLLYSRSNSHATSVAPMILSRVSELRCGPLRGVPIAAPD
jgi:hypothetical protein